MINTIKADFYRLIHTLGFWITQLVMLAITVAIIVFQSAGTVGVSTGSGSEAAARAAQDAAQRQVDKWTGADVLSIFSEMSSFLLYYLIAILIITIGNDIRKGGLKNLFSSGTSRFNFFVTKYLIFNLTAVVQMILFYLIAFTTASLLNGVGTFPSDFLGRFLGSSALQLLLLQAIFAACIFVLYLTFSSVWAVLTAVVLPMTVSLLSAVAFPKVKWLTYLDFQNGMSFTMKLSTNDITGYLIAACVSIVAFIGSAYVLFSKKDL